MIIKNYNCQRFAGIKDKNIDFKDGLNVILGKNESGKSTLIEGIHAVLFKSIKNDRRLTADSEFQRKFRPLPDGDVFDGKLVLIGDDGEYRISRVWGGEPSIQMITPQNDKIVNEGTVDEILQQILLFGEGTYSNILFSKQDQIRAALHNMTGDIETVNEVSTLLQRAVMEMDGVPIDELESRIDTEIEGLLKRWDREKNYPENNRGIHNPYKTGIGEVLASYYKKEGLRLEMEEALARQLNFDEICSSLKDLEGEYSEIKEELQAMEEIEEDVTARLQMEPLLGQYEKDLGLLMKINIEWPKNEEKLEQIERALKTMGEEYNKLEEEKTRAARIQEKEALQKRIGRLIELQGRIEAKQRELESIKEITPEDMDKLEEYQREMHSLAAKMQAGTMFGQLIHYSGEGDLYMIKDLEEPVLLEEGTEFKADAFLRLESDNISLEIKTGETDFNELRNQYENNKRDMEKTLLELGAAGIKEARSKKENRDHLSRELSLEKKQLMDLLEGDTLKDLEEELQGYGELSGVRELPAIEAAIKDIDKEKIELLAAKINAENSIAEWSKEYGNLEGLLDKIVGVKMAQNQSIEKLSGLAPLPEGYESAVQFRRRLGELRQASGEMQALFLKLKEDYYRSESALPITPYEELEKELQQAEKDFSHKMSKANKLLKIKEVFRKTRQAIDEDSFKPLAEAFSRYVKLLTRGSFKSGEVENDFALRLAKNNDTEIPMDLLSTGTYGSVALALRLAILEHILGDHKGFMILDDCLVDLDPDRKKSAADLIKDFAVRHQVIFTTCDPETAELLGGNLIQIQAG
jgi:exonuclease SbcC